MTVGAVPVNEVRAARRLGAAAMATLLALIILLANIDHLSSRTVALRFGAGCQIEADCAVLVADLSEHDVATVVRQQVIPVTAAYPDSVCRFGATNARLVDRLQATASQPSRAVLRVRLDAQGKRCIVGAERQGPPVWTISAKESYLSIIINAFLRR